MAEWRIYASSSNKKQNGLKFWKNNGTDKSRENVKKAIQPAIDFMKRRGVPTYLGAWMPQENKGGDLKRQEVINFARYFVRQLCNEGIPWLLNVPSAETQGQIVGAREGLNGRKNMARRKVKNGEKSPWEQCLTRPVPNGRRRSGF